MQGGGQQVGCLCHEESHINGGLNGDMPRGKLKGDLCRHCTLHPTVPAADCPKAVCSKGRKEDECAHVLGGMAGAGLVNGQQARVTHAAKAAALITTDPTTGPPTVAITESQKSILGASSAPSPLAQPVPGQRATMAGAAADPSVHSNIHWYARAMQDTFASSLPKSL